MWIYFSVAVKKNFNREDLPDSYNTKKIIMDFRFNVNNLLPKRINKITHTLIPEGFRGDRREYK